MKRGFDIAEYESRLARSQALMHDAGFHALLFCTEAEIRYFTGFLTQFWQSPTRPWFLIVPLTGKPVAVIPEIGLALMQSCWIDDIRTWQSLNPTDDGVGLLAKTIREVVGGTGRLGLPMGSETHIRMPMNDFESLRRCLTGIEIGDCTALIRGLRMIKSAAEIAKIEHVCGLVSDVFESGPALFKEGQSEIEAFQAFKIACLRAGVDDVRYLVGGAGPGGYSDIISPPSDRRFRPGDVLMLDTGAVFDGYFCDFDRNFSFAYADDPVRRAYDVLFAATEAGLKMARPGVTCAALFQTMQAVLSAGAGQTGAAGRFGHGLGMQLTEWPSNADFDHTELQAGMVITLEPSMVFAPGRMMVHEENIVIVADGARLLSRRAPPEIPIL